MKQCRPYCYFVVESGTNSWKPDIWLAANGPEHKLDVRHRQVWLRFDEREKTIWKNRSGSGAEHVGPDHRKCDPVETHQVVEGTRHRPTPAEPRGKMILEVATYRQIDKHVDTQFGEMPHGAYSGQHQQLRRMIGPGAENHLTLCRGAAGLAVSYTFHT